MKITHSVKSEIKYCLFLSVITTQTNFSLFVTCHNEFIIKYFHFISRHKHINLCADSDLFCCYIFISVLFLCYLFLLICFFDIHILCLLMNLHSNFFIAKLLKLKIITFPHIYLCKYSRSCNVADFVGWERGNYH